MKKVHLLFTLLLCLGMNNLYAQTDSLIHNHSFCVKDQTSVHAFVVSNEITTLTGEICIDVVYQFDTATNITDIPEFNIPDRDGSPCYK